MKYKLLFLILLLSLSCNSENKYRVSDELLLQKRSEIEQRAIENEEKMKNDEVEISNREIKSGARISFPFVVLLGLEKYYLITANEETGDLSWIDVSIDIFNTTDFPLFEWKGNFYYLIRFGKYIEFIPEDIDNSKTGIQSGSFFPETSEKFIRSIDSDSFFVENIDFKQIGYEASNLISNFFYTEKPKFLYMNSEITPWVEGSQGNGVGESLSISFYEEQEGFMILNGFFNRQNLRLYLENNRVKEFRITYPDGTISEHLIVDSLGFHNIFFTQAAQDIVITITSIYEGTRFNDTAISGLLPLQRDLTKTSLKTYENKLLDEFRAIEDINEVGVGTKN
jgi:hypothetical protein